MYQRTAKLTVGTGDASGLIQRIQADLTPLIEGASGFIAYTAVKVDDQTVITTRLFRDLASMDAETGLTQQDNDQITADFQLTAEYVVDSDVNIGVASEVTEVYQP
jgi:hypothetical protein